MQSITSLFSEFLETLSAPVVCEEPVEDVEEEAEAEEEEEEEDEEPEDTFPAIQAECAETKVCHPFKHHFDECVERVTKAMEADDYEEQEHKEDCIEEFFHLQHCVTECAAPLLFKTLK
ncbi:ubiquinol-cytochrome C reductase hinge domain-containing protein [Dipodascopsis tothii]|uniref:ubiquinol-cytochrome C reductase hinge domain-containing protein n=1 Tax=Dipodascopsis tothii TaxID=44089 RepID=UPI0034CDB355